MDWSNIKGIFANKFKEAEHGLGKLVKMTSPKRNHTQQNTSSKFEKQSPPSTLDIPENQDPYTLYNDIQNKLNIATKILEEKDKQLLEKERSIVELKSNSRYFKDGQIMTIAEIQEEFSKKLASVEKEYKEAMKERDLLKKELNVQIDMTATENLDHDIHELKEDESRVNQRIASTKKDILELEEVITLNQKRIDEQKKSIAILSGSLNETNLMLNKTLKEELDDKSILEALKNESNSSKQEVDRCRSNLKNREDEMLFMKSELTQLSQENQEMLKEQERIVHSIDSEKQKIRDILKVKFAEDIARVKTSLDESINSSHETKETLLFSIASLKKEIAEIEKQSLEEIKKLESSLEDAEAQNFKLSNNSISVNRPLLKEIHKLQKQIHQIELSIHEEEFKLVNIKSMENDLNAERAKNQELQKICDLMKKRVDKRIHVNKENEAKVLLLTQELEGLRASLKIKDKEKEESLIAKEKDAQLLKEIEVENETLERKLTASKTEYEILENQLKETLQDKPCDIVTDIPTKEESNDQTMDMTSPTDIPNLLQDGLVNRDLELESTRKEIEKTRASISSLEFELVTMKEEIKQYRQQTISLDAIAEDKQAVEVRLNVTLDLIVERTDLLSQLTKEMQELKDDYKDKINTLCQQISDKK